jgi:hypothetical protein
MTEHHHKAKSDYLVKVLYIAGLYGAFVFSGVYEESLYKGKFTNDQGQTTKFKHPMLAIFMVSFLSYALSSLMLLTL